MNHPARARIAEIVVERPGGPPVRGSGYLVAPGRVLTAAHVVAGAEAIGVWFGVQPAMAQAAGHSVDPATVSAMPDADLAILVVPAAPALSDPPLFGAVDRDATAPVPAVAAGCPRFKLRPAPGRPGVQLREVHHALGRIEPGSNAKTGTLEFTVLAEVPADPEPDRHSPWEGMSGAAVFAGSRIVGVVGQHELREPNGTLTVRPIADGAPHLWTALGRPPATLEPVAEPVERDLVVARADRAARKLAPPVLVAREDEIARLHAFVAGPERLLWLVGPAFSGKTAVLAWFVLHPPEGVAVAACFLRRTTGDADARYVIDVLGRQLAVHADRPYLPAAHVSTQRDDLLDLLDEAAAACAQRGQRLLLIVDGLDEDQTPEPGLAVASWLPGEDALPPNAWLLVAGRTGVTHRITLAPSEAAAGLEHTAKLEVQAARLGGGLVYPLLGLLAAGVGDWTTEELTEVLRAQGSTDVLNVQVADTLTAQLARAVAIDDGHVALAHDALLDEARRLYADDLPRLRDAVLDWCHAAMRRAESGEPLARYVARHYVDQLAARDGWTPHWVDLLRPAWRAYRDASPTTYLALRDDLRRLDAAARAAGAPALAVRVATAAALAETSGEIKTTSPELAAALVRAGRWSSARALNYLARLDDRYERALAIGVVAPALAPEPDVIELAEALYAGLGGPSDDVRGSAAFGVASLLAAAGDPHRVWAFVKAQPQLGPCEAANAAAGALAGLDGDDLAGLLAFLTEHASGLGRDAWELAPRLAALDAGARTRVEAVLGHSLGRLVLDLLDVGVDDEPLDVGEALLIAGPCLADDECLDWHRNAMAAATGSWGESDMLANIAESAPPELYERIDRRSARLALLNHAGSDRGLVAAGLLRRADESLRSRLVAELRATKYTFSATHDGRTFLRRLVTGGLGVEALASVRERASRGADDSDVARDIAAIAPYLHSYLLPDALELGSALVPPWRSNARGALYARAVAIGRDDLVDISADRWADADWMRRLALEPGWTPPAPPTDPWLVAAAAARLGLRGRLPVLRCAAWLLESPAFDQPAVTAILRALPLTEADVNALRAVLNGHQLGIDRCLRDLVRVVAARHGSEAVWRLAESGDPVLPLYVATACGQQLADPARLRRLLENTEPALANAALGAVADVHSRLSPEDVGEGRLAALRVLEALPPALRPDVLERLLPDDYLTGRRGLVTGYDWASTRLGWLAHSMSRRQVDVVEEAVSQQRTIGSSPRATLRAALARRRAALGDLDGFERTWHRIADTDLRVRTLLVALGRYPIAELPRWIELARGFAPLTDAPQRALLWSLAAETMARLGSDTATALAGRWLDETEYSQPGEVFLDLLGLVPLLPAQTGSEISRYLSFSQGSSAA